MIVSTINNKIRRRFANMAKSTKSSKPSRLDDLVDDFVSWLWWGALGPLLGKLFGNDYVDTTTTREQVADFLERFARGDKVGDHEYDDFTTFRYKDPLIDQVAREVFSLENDCPSTSGLFSEPATQRLLELAALLRASSDERPPETERLCQTEADGIPGQLRGGNMLPFSDVVAALKALYQPDSEGAYHYNVVKDEQIRQWIDETGLLRSELYDRIALYLAHGFHERHLEFGFCDCVVNDFYSVAIHTDRILELPTTFWHTFEAFDQGEFYHDKYQLEDPIETYTRPAIAEIVRTHKQT
jgi:hypothetical protein